MGAVRDDNFIVEHGWMINRLDLKGNELRIYAIIYGFSQTGGQEFTGSLQYLADWVNGSKQGVQKNLKTLIERGLISKRDFLTDGVKQCAYRAIELPPMQQSCTGYTTQLHGGMQQSCINNIPKKDTSKDIDNKEGEALTPSPVPLEPPKRKGGKAYKLTAPEIEAMLARYAPSPEALELLRDWLTVRKAKRAPETEKALSLNLVKLDKLARESGLTVEGYLEAVIARGWAAFFPIHETRAGGQAPVNIRSRVKTEAEHAAGQTASGFGGW